MSEEVKTTEIKKAEVVQPRQATLAECLIQLNAIRKREREERIEEEKAIAEARRMVANRRLEAKTKK